jgi:uncharacterized membrane protein (UPF0127 family)
MKKILRVLSILTCGCFLSGQAVEESLESAFDRSVLVITATENACYKFDIYLAQTSAQHSRGLMRVRYLPEFTGMLFIYQQQRNLSMWMKNTYIPLDMLFIRADGSIANIAAHTTPLSLDSVSAVEPLNFVLELNAGVTERLHIDTESIIHFP